MTQSAAQIKLEIFNDAAALVGMQRMVDVDQNTEAGRTLRGEYTPGLRRCATEAPWTFIIERQASASGVQLDNTSSYYNQWGYSHTVSTDALRIWWVGDVNASDEQEPIPYNLVHRTIYTDCNSILIDFHSETNALDETRFPDYYRGFVAARLAFDIATRVGKDRTVYDRVKREFMRRKLDAQNEDAGQRGSRPRRSGKWLRAHRASGTFRGRRWTAG